jgi:hypothetical protein
LLLRSDLISTVPDVPKPSTPVQRLASVLIGRPVTSFIAERRAAGDTWQTVRDALCEATAGEVDVTWQAVQKWAAEAELQAVAG